PGSDEERIAVLDVHTAIAMLQTLHEAHTGRGPEPARREPPAGPAGRGAAAPSPSAPSTPPPVSTAPASEVPSTSPGSVRARLRVLGDPTVLDVEPGGRPFRSKARELAVFLACHRDGADTRTLGEHLAPDSRVRQADQTVH